MKNVFVNSLILYILTISVVFFILSTSQPRFVKKSKKLCRELVLGYSLVLSLVFVFLITLLSIRVDNQYNNKKN